MEVMAKRSLLLALVLTAGCNQYLRPGDLPALQAQVAADKRDLAWQRAIEVLLDAGYVPDVLNEDAAYISAHFRDDAQLDSLTGVHAIVVIAIDGRVRVQVSGSGQYATTTGLADDLRSAEQDLLTRIVAAVGPKPAAPRVPAPPSPPAA